MYYRTKIKRNLCHAPGCHLPIWGLMAIVISHQYFYAAKQPIPKYKPKKPKEAERYGCSTQLETFMHKLYHADRPIICPVSKRNITLIFNEEPKVWINCCHHVLKKGNYTKWKFNPYNIVLIDPEVHFMWHNTAILKRQKLHPDWDWAYLENLTAQYKIEYEREFTTGTTAPDDTTEEITLKSQ